MPKKPIADVLRDEDGVRLKTTAWDVLRVQAEDVEFEDAMAMAAVLNAGLPDGDAKRWIVRGRRVPSGHPRDPLRSEACS